MEASSELRAQAVLKLGTAEDKDSAGERADSTLTARGGGLREGRWLP